MSVALSSQFGQDQVRRQIEEKRKKLLENTRNSILAHTKENTFVHTDAVNEALVRVKGNGIVILIGPPGIGKSRIGIELLRKLIMDNDKCLPIQLDDISQWQDMCNDMDVVLIDDVFGRTNCSYNDDVHSKLLDMIFSTIQNKKAKAILTLRNNIYRTITTRIESLRVFHDEHILNLGTSKYQMTEKEKRSCLMNYFAHNNIVVTDDIEKENINDDSVLDNTITVYLHKATIQKILHVDIGTHIGFPETCYLFASHRKFTRQGHIFFCHPTERLKREIDDLRMEGDTNKRSMIDFTLLVYILLNGDSVNINSVDHETLLSMMETIYLNPLRNIPPLYIIDSANRLNGKYLKINNDGYYCFQHRLISEAVMISYSSTDPKRVIPLLGFDFITEMARPLKYKPSEGEVIFAVPRSCYIMLAQRLLQLLSTENKKEPYKFKKSEQYKFVQNLCKSKIITMTGNTILQEMITQYKYNKSDRYWDIKGDHRFSGHHFFYILKPPYFYFPAALLIFCNTDNDSVYQCLYDRIHDTLTLESDSDAIQACKETLVEVLNFAVCTLDVKKSTAILNILSDHNIKQDNLPLDFCDNIVSCQGLPGVQLLLNLHDLSHVFNITSLLSEIFMTFYSEGITIDGNMKQFITSVIENNNHDKLLMNYIVEHVCRYGQFNFVKNVCERFDSGLLNVDNMIIQACISRNTEVIQWLLEMYDGLYYVQGVLDKACYDGFTDVVKAILNIYDATLLNMESSMNEACSSGNIELIKWLCENVDNNLFDLKTGMNMACNIGNTELVKWLCENVDNNLFDMKTGMNMACSSGNIELIKWLCENIDNNLLDLKTGMNMACNRGNTKLVKWLCENVDNNLFDMKTGMNMACSSGNIELVKWLCENVDNNLFDLKTGMNMACNRGNTELVKWLFEGIDNNLFDMKTVVNVSFSSGNTELVKWLCENVDNNLFDMKSGINNACSSGNTELVKWLCENVDNNLFDMKSVIMYTYSHYNSRMLHYHIGTMMRGYLPDDKEIIYWLFDNFDPDLFDIDSADYTASRFHYIDHIQFVYYKEIN